MSRNIFEGGEELTLWTNEIVGIAHWDQPEASICSSSPHLNICARPLGYLATFTNELIQNVQLSHEFQMLDN